MGWSFEVKAGEVMDRFMALHDKQDGLIHFNGHQFFIEPSNKEYQDGRIRMRIFRMVDQQRAREVATFYILPGGKIKPQKFALLEETLKPKRKEEK